MSTAIEFNNISKQYRLGVVSSRTLSHDLNRWWAMNILHKEDPYLKIGETNDRTSRGDSEYVWALKNIDFKVEQGDVIGIIGKNGAGKSTLLKILSRVTGPTTGSIRARGRIGSLLEVGTGFHPEMTGRENIYMNGAIMGMTKAEISRKLDEIVDFSGCERYLDTPTKRYSSGMTVRLGFAVAAFLEPEILVVDEVLAVGDAEFQKKAIGKMQDVSCGEGRTVLFVSHNMASIKQLCKHGVVLKNGCVDYHGGIREAVTYYLKDNAFKSGQILETVKYHSSILHVDEFLLNGKSANAIQLNDGCRELNFDIEGSVKSSQRMEMEAQLYDANHVLLASYCPCHIIGRSTSYPEGKFSIHECITLPENITKGTFFLELQLTEPNISYLCTLSQPIKVETEGCVGAGGMSMTYERGFIIL